MSARLSDVRTRLNNASNTPAADEPREQRRSEHKDLPPAYSTTSTTTATSINTLETHVTAITQQQQQQHDVDLAVPLVPEPVVAAPTFLQPRVAALLGVSRPWHPVLFLLRLFSIVPAIYLGFPVAIRGLLLLYGAIGIGHEAAGLDGRAGEDKLLLTETILALMWCGCSGYLSFYFTDCLMSRW